jgi:hypothetical protein
VESDEGYLEREILDLLKLLDLDRLIRQNGERKLALPVGVKRARNDHKHAVGLQHAVPVSCKRG